MTDLYTCRSLPGSGFTITKFTEDFEPQGSYETTNATCTCPAGVRPTCRHRQMLGKFFERHHVDDGWFLDWDTKMWHRPLASAASDFVDDDWEERMADGAEKDELRAASDEPTPALQPQIIRRRI